MAYPRLITADQAVEIINELSAKPIKPATFRGYVSRAQAPQPVDKIGATRLYKRTEIEKWAKERPGQGARVDLQGRPRRRKADEETPVADQPTRDVS